MREIVHMQAGQCGNQIGAKVSYVLCFVNFFFETYPDVQFMWFLKDVIFYCSSGKLSPTNMASIQLAHTTVIPIYSWKESTFITMKLQV